MLNSKTKNQIINYFAKKPEIAAVYLYGSQARGEAKSDSDIDLAVLITDYRKYKGFGIPQVTLSLELAKLTSKEVEVQDLASVSIDFAYRTLSEGELLTTNNQKARVSFEERVLRDYFDMKPAIEEYYKGLAEITKKGQLHVRYI